ncbi:MAG: rhomboid family intramembrane serine protease [Flavobacteriaceae bacterium]
MGRITETVKVLLICNVLFFIGKLSMPEVSDHLFALHYPENPNFQYWQIVTHMFMHASFPHILFNMFGLYMFGSPLEARWGRNKFLFFYFSAGLGAALIHSGVSYLQFTNIYNDYLATGLSNSEIYGLMDEVLEKSAASVDGYIRMNMPNNLSLDSLIQMTSIYNGQAVGASGAIYGILVAFGMMYPNVELMLIFLPIPVKAKYFIPALLLLDLFSGLTGFSLFGQNIANWAHLGGALFGFIMAYYWKKNSFNDHRWN